MRPFGVVLLAGSVLATGTHGAGGRQASAVSVPGAGLVDSASAPALQAGTGTVTGQIAGEPDSDPIGAYQTKITQNPEVESKYGFYAGDTGVSWLDGYGTS